MSPLLFAVYVDDLAKSCDAAVVLYADDILLLTPTVSELQNILNTCERELQALDLVINVKKSCCLRIGPRNDVNWERLSSVWHIPAMDERGQNYLGIYLVSSKRFKISTEHSRRSFYRAANAIFGRIGIIATEEVVLHLLLTKCVPILLYGFKACSIR